MKTYKQAIRQGLFLLIISLVIVNACTATEPPKTLTVFVSILPEVEFITRVGGNRVQVSPLVLPGQSPATYAPTPKQMASLARADLYFRIGVPFENSLIPKLQKNIPDLTIIDLRNGIDLLTDNDQQAGSLDPHIWLDPTLVSQLTDTIREALTVIDPDGADQYLKNAMSFQKNLAQLDKQLRQLLQPLAEQTIYVFHPAYAYFCRAYNLFQRAIAAEGKIPGARSLARLIEQAKHDQVRFIFIQPQFSRKTAQSLAQSIGATLIPLDPLAEDYMANMLNMGESIATALQKEALQ
jgi:zinc transport system substrate-binding protein